MRTIKDVRRPGVALTVFTLVGGGLLVGPEAASAQTCIQDVWQAHGNNNNLNVRPTTSRCPRRPTSALPPGAVATPLPGSCRCFAGETVTFTADFRMDLTTHSPL